MASLATWLRTFGFDPKRAINAIQSLPRYYQERLEFRRRLSDDFAWGSDLPILDERNESSGSLGAYFHQDQLVAQWIYQNSPSRHIDIGSRIDGFIGHLAVFREVEVMDIRPLPDIVKNIISHQLDLMAELPDAWIECTDSLSCLHTIEHFGLGRYGDTIDPNGYMKGLAQMKRMVKPGGLFYLSTPIGPQRIEFNAHRIFSPKTLIGWFDDGWEIEECAVVDDECKVVTESGSRLLTEARCHTGVGIVAARKAP